MLLKRSANSQPSPIRVKQLKSLGKNRLVLGRILVLSGIGGLLVTGYAAAVAIWWRLLLPWTDMDPLLPYAIIDVLITSICACWLGVGFVRRKLSFE